MPASVLLVDDERFARTVYSDYLRAAGYEVELADDPDAAIRLLRARAFDVLLTDVVMPGGNGLQLLAEAKQLDPDIQVIVITALDRVGPAVRAMRAGAADYLVKPVTAEALQVSVQRSLATRALLAENTALRGHLNLFETCQRITAGLEREKLVPIALSALCSESGAAHGVLVEREDGGWRVTGTHDVAPEAAEALLATASARLGDLGLDGAVALDSLRAASPAMPGDRALCLPVGDGSQLLGAACLFVPADLDFERAGRTAFVADGGSGELAGARRHGFGLVVLVSGPARRTTS